MDPESTAPTAPLAHQALPTDLPAPSAPDLTEPKEEQPPVPSSPTEEEEEEEEEEGLVLVSQGWQMYKKICL